MTLFDYLSKEFNLILLESDLNEITRIVLDEQGVRWIPITEKLPDNNGYYEITIEEIKGKQEVSTAHFINGRFYSSNVIAWRQIKPYKYD